jgi:hypothetical protein
MDFKPSTLGIVYLPWGGFMLNNEHTTNQKLGNPQKKHFWRALLANASKTVRTGDFGYVRVTVKVSTHMAER